MILKNTQMTQHTPGQKFKLALSQETPLQIVGVINAYAALMAQATGFKVLYLSGAGIANACYALPDLGMTTATQVIEEARRITTTTQRPLLVDIDTGFGHELNIETTIRQLIKIGVAGIHIEDQVAEKRCGHRPGKQLVPIAEMQVRIQTAVNAKNEKGNIMDPDFVVIARTDAYRVEGIHKAIQRTQAYQVAGADMIFAESLASLDEYQQFAEAVNLPVLANMTEFGQTPLYSLDELKNAKVAMVLYPLSAFRAMNQAALNVFECIRNQGSQVPCLTTMQSREQLYDTLGYHEYEERLNKMMDPHDDKNNTTSN